CDFPGHGDVTAHGDACQRGDDGGTHADTGTGPVLGCCAFRYVQMQVVLLHEIGVNAQTIGARAHHRQRRLHRLLHDIADTAGNLRLALAGHDGSLNGQQFTTDFGPGEPRDLTDAVV